MQTSGLPTRTPTPFANSGAKNTIPVASQIAVTPGAASYTDGFPPLTRTPIAAGGVPPFGVDFNGILNAITTAVRWSNAGGQYSYDATFSTAVGGYPKGAILARSGFDGFWISTVENNTTNPDTGGAGWIALNGQGGDYGVDAGTANIYAVTYSPAVIALKDGMTLKFKAANANTGASTFNPNGLGASPIVGSAHSALQGGEIAATGDVWLQWNSSIGSGSWVLIDSTGGALQVGTATKSLQAINFGQLATLKSLQRFTSSGNFTVPTGVTQIWTSGCAGGGGGGATLATNSSSFLTGGSGGGAGQSVIRVPITVTPGQVIPVTIGTGGTGGTAATNNAGTGGVTQLGASGALLSLAGGVGGAVGAGGTASPSIYGGPAGGGGYPSGSYASDTVVYSGGIAVGGGGGIGASTPFGIAGGAGRGASGGSNAGQPGYGYGAGGSGAGGAYNSTVSAAGAAGAAGLPGILIIEW